MALTLANLSAAAQQAVIDRATNAGVSSPNDIRNILLAYLASTGQPRTVTSGTTLTSQDNNSIIYVNSASDVIVYIDYLLPIGFSCVIVQQGAGKVKLRFPDGNGDLTGPGGVTGNYDTTGTGLGVSLNCYASELFHCMGSVTIV